MRPSYHRKVRAQDYISLEFLLPWWEKVRMSVKAQNEILVSYSKWVTYKKSFQYFQDRPSCCLRNTRWGWKPRFDMPWHVATLIRRNTLCPYNFIFFGRGLIYHAHSKSVIARSSTLLWLDDVAISFRKIFLKKKMKFSRRKGHSSEW